MRIFFAATVAATLIATSALAATDGSALAPGRPAGVKHAQDMSDTTVWWLVGLGVVAAGIGLVASGSNNNALTSGTIAATTSSK